MTTLLEDGLVISMTGLCQCVRETGEETAMTSWLEGRSVHFHNGFMQVCEGDEMEIAVTNMLEDGLTTSIHWHGQHVFGAPYFDGVGQITQCSIQYLERFV